MSDAPVLTIDGPSGSGKGAVGRRVAQALGWHYLDSGAVYRLCAFAALNRGVDLDDTAGVVQIVPSLQAQFTEDGRVLLVGQDVSDHLRTEECGNAASRIASQPAVRSALLQWQRSFLRPPGLVADGRDMGTVVFPSAGAKIFLVASPGERARRRYNQLKDKGIDVNLPELSRDIEERDKRDASRAVAPLAPAVDAVVLDSTDVDLEQVVGRVLKHVTAIG